VTHAKPRRDAFDGYDRGEHWEPTCAEVAKLKLKLKRVKTARKLAVLDGGK
jgi:hypothetical protein